MITDLTILAATLVGLFLTVHGATTSNPLGVGGSPWKDLWTFDGEIGVAQYLSFAVSLCAVAYALARAAGAWAAAPVAWPAAALTARLWRGAGRSR